jgi:KDO2-lipid IV(A) lauroyltransferase
LSPPADPIRRGSPNRRAAEMNYSCRAHLLQPACDYELHADRVLRRGPRGTAVMLFSDIEEIAVFKERRFGSSRSFWACTVKGGGRKFRLTSAHRAGLLKREDRTAGYIPFIKEFERRALAANSAIRFIDDEFRETIGIKASGVLSLWVLALMRCFTRRQAASICGAAVRWVGPMLRGHRHARGQLHAAFPAMGSDEARGVLLGMWDNIGRTFGEYGHIPELMAFSADTPAAGQVVMDERTAELVRRIGSERRGALMFAAHLGNWEIPAMTARVGGREIALAYKPQPSKAMTDRLIQARSLFAGRLIEARPAAPREMLKALRDGWLVGMLVDQHYADGVEVSFFKHICRVNPILARLARGQDWPVYGARAVRLPDQRYRFEVVGPLEFPRDASGKIDVPGAMQMVFGIIETWIREHPEQWMWAHRVVR